MGQFTLFFIYLGLKSLALALAVRISGYGYGEISRLGEELLRLGVRVRLELELGPTDKCPRW